MLNWVKRKIADLKKPRADDLDIEGGDIEMSTFPGETEFAEEMNELSVVEGAVGGKESVEKVNEVTGGGKGGGMASGGEVGKTGRDMSGEFGKVFPMLFPYLDKPSILALRPVCKSFKQGIDTFLQEHPMLKPYNLETAKAIKKSLLSPGYFPGPVEKSFQGVVLSTLEQLQRFSEQWKDVNHVNYNPFFERNVTFIPKLSELKSGNGAKYWSNVFAVLKRFGAHIWYLTVDITPVSPRFVLEMTNYEYYDRLHVMLKLTPNLKTLRLHGNTPRESQALLGIRTQQTLLGCYFHIKSKPLPKLKGLTTLEFNSQELIGPLRDGIAEQFLKQLKKLRITVGSMPEGGMPVEELEVTCWPDNQLLELCELPKFKAPGLKKLSIIMMPRDFIMELFLEIVSYFPTVEYLSMIFMPGWVVKQLATEERLIGISESWTVPSKKKFMFPGIKILELKMDIPGVKVHSFINRFPGLEQMIVKTVPEDPECDVYGEKEEHEFDEALRTGKIFNRVIWRMVPSLKELVHVSDDPFEELEVGNYGQWENRPRWEWKRRPEMECKIKRCTRDMIQDP